MQSTCQAPPAVGLVVVAIDLFFVRSRNGANVRIGTYTWQTVQYFQDLRGFKNSNF